ALPYSDASGVYNATNGERSDNRVMRKYGFNVRRPRQNPAVMDRIHALQSMVLNSSKQRRLSAHTTRCPQTVRSLQNQVFNQWGKPDNTQGWDHLNDALGYLTHARYPIREQARIEVY